MKKIGELYFLLKSCNFSILICHGSWVTITSYSATHPRFIQVAAVSEPTQAREHTKLDLTKRILYCFTLLIKPLHILFRQSAKKGEEEKSISPNHGVKKGGNYVVEWQEAGRKVYLRNLHLRVSHIYFSCTSNCPRTGWSDMRQAGFFLAFTPSPPKRSSAKKT